MPETTSSAAAPLIAAGARVILVVSKGPDPSPATPRVVVPEVDGKMQAKALKALQAAGLQARVVNDYSDTHVSGKVMGQLPAAGSSAVDGTAVTLLVSTGASAQVPPRVALPDVVGMQEGQAVEKLKTAQLAPQMIEEHSPTVPAGIVMSQLPDAAWLAANPTKKTNWWVWIAAAVVVLALALLAVFFLGGEKVEVPNVVGMSQEDAATEIETAGLTLGEVTQVPSAEVAEGDVISQTPAAGEEASEGSRVDLEVSSGAEMVAVPDLVGLTQTEAITALLEAGLQASPKNEPTDSADPGTVIAQSPAAQVEVDPGTVVEITVAAAPTIEAIEVPNVVGLADADARKEIQDAGLTVQVVSSPSADVPEGVVISQLPQPGSAAVPGASVAIVVSSGAPEEPATVKVPDVVGQELADAEEALGKAGLEVEATPTSGTAENSGDVLAQLPEAGASVVPGSTVVLLYAE